MVVSAGLVGAKAAKTAADNPGASLAIVAALGLGALLLVRAIPSPAALVESGGEALAEGTGDFLSGLLRGDDPVMLTEESWGRRIAGDVGSTIRRRDPVASIMEEGVGHFVPARTLVGPTPFDDPTALPSHATIRDAEGRLITEVTNPSFNVPTADIFAFDVHQPSLATRVGGTAQEILFGSFSGNLLIGPGGLIDTAAHKRGFERIRGWFGR